MSHAVRDHQAPHQRRAGRAAAIAVGETNMRIKTRPITERRRQRFLAALRETGNVRGACIAAAVPRTNIYEHRRADEAFAKAWEEAVEIATDRLEAEAWRRGVDGVPEPLVSAGRLVSGEDGKPVYVQRYSDSLLTLLLRANRDKFRERTAVELDVSDRLAERLEAARQRAIAKPVGSVLEGVPALKLVHVAGEGGDEE
jgi:hypothetical protein